MKVGEVIRLLRAGGWTQVRMTGSHRHYKHATKPGTVTVPGHNSDTLAPGTLASIRRQSGVNTIR